jgi:hypothetical protein
LIHPECFWGLRRFKLLFFPDWGGEMVMFRTFVSLLVALTVVVVVAQAKADFIGTTDGNTVTVTAGSQWDSGSPPANLENTNGMSTTGGYVTMSSTVTGWNSGNIFHLWLSDSSAGGGSHINGGPGSGNNWILFTFTNTTDLSEAVIWNGDASPVGRDIKGAVITYSTGANATGVGNSFFSGNLNEVANDGNGNPTGASGYTNDLFNPGGYRATNVKAVMIVFSSNWEGDTSATAWYWLDKVFFNADTLPAASIPEPGTLALLAAGLAGLLCYAWRKRR